MFYLEFKRSIHNKTLIYLITVTAVAFMMGWVLPFSLEHIVYVNFNYYMFSTYTVFTQFGFLLFGFVTAFYFNKDYKDKNTLFYMCFKVSVLRYFIVKVLILLIEESFCIVSGLIIVGIVFNSFEYFFTTFLLYTLIVLQYFVIVGTISIIFGNILSSLGVSIAYWIGSIIVVSLGGICKYAAVFDASNSFYGYVENYFSRKMPFPVNELKTLLIGIGTMIIVAFAIVQASSKSWVKRGL